MHPFLSHVVIWCGIFVATLGWAGQAKAQTSDDFLTFIREEAKRLRQSDPLFGPVQGKEVLTNAIRRSELTNVWGGEEWMAEVRRTPLDPKSVGIIEKKDYRIEKVHFQTFQGIRMPGLLYLPKSKGKHPAVLHVHGHWRGAKQDPVVQARCVACVRAGFVVLCVDAFGAGERGIGTALGEYHGEMTGATLFPAGIPLSGIQVVENGKAVDYLCQRPEVDPTKLAVTGASGGGNQTMYAGSFDNRFKAVVPVCSVGNYQSYLGQACCMCEVVPGALQFTEEDAILGLTAPRALMVISATRDAVQFSPPEAAKSIARARILYGRQGVSDKLVHKIFESGHDYSRPMRESMVGFLKQHLLGQGDGSPVPEKPFEHEEPESLRLFPGNSRPADWPTLPQFAKAQGQLILAKTKPADLGALKKVLHGQGKISLGGPAQRTGENQMMIETEKGITLKPTWTEGALHAPFFILLHEEGATAAQKHPLALELAKKGRLVTVDLRATGKLAPTGDRIGAAPDHNSAEWSLWLGRPLLGQWSLDVMRIAAELRRVDPTASIHVVGIGPMGLTALAAGAQDSTLGSVIAYETLASYLTDKPYKNQRLGTIVPNILREVGDIPALAALCKSRVVIAGGVNGQGQPFAPEAMSRHFQKAIFANPGLVLVEAQPRAVLAALTKTKDRQ